MTRRVIFVTGFVLIAAFSAAAFLLLRPTQEASAPIEAIPLDLGQLDAQATEEILATAAEPTGDIAAAGAPENEVSESTASGSETEPGLTIFRIDPANSRARFELDEDLRGVRNTVVGETNQISGEIAVDFADLSSLEVGTILVNARTLQTDNDFRNRAIGNQILDTAQFEFISFAAREIDGLPGSAAVGDEASFTMTGDLTIRDVTNEVTFQLEVTTLSNSSFSGSASAVVTREAFGLVIPEVRNVANVEEEVEVYIDFVAVSG
jgi:polyisoprenoid-binding protein YceI